MHFQEMRTSLIRKLLETDPFNAGTWQRLDVSGSSSHDTYELQQVTIFYPMPQTIRDAVEFIQPDLPWAEGHFRERIAGQPVNPGAWHDKWPYHLNAEALHQHEGKYDHNYMERFWPTSLMPQGYRFKTGDLQDVIQLLIREPFTRQAYLPVWFPEDTGVAEGQRVPCTLGYQFMVRHNQLHLSYHLRSCEAYRHFTNDVYMAVRLAQEVANEVTLGWASNGVQGAPQALSMGHLHMTVGSFHGFVGDLDKLEELCND